ADRAPRSGVRAGRGAAVGALLLRRRRRAVRRSADRRRRACGAVIARAAARARSGDLLAAERGQTMRLTLLACAGAAAALVPAPAWSAGALQRYALVVGANAGGADRPLLQYAISDAERFGRVLVEIGGVAPAHEIVLRQPKLRDLTDAFDLLARQASEARRAPGTRTEV